MYSLPASCAEVVKTTVLASDCFLAAFVTVKPSIVKSAALTSSALISFLNVTSTVVALIAFTEATSVTNTPFSYSKPLISPLATLPL